MTSFFPRLRWLLFVGIALMAGVVVYSLLDRTAATAPPPLRVLVATRDIQIAETITSTMVEVRQIPSGALPGPTAALESDLPLVLQSSAREPLYRGEIISKIRLFRPGLSLSGAPDEALVTKGLALTTLPASRMAMPLSGLRAGDHVAVIASFTSALPGAADLVGTNVRTSGLVVQTIDPYALVTFVDPAGAALTLATPRAEVTTLQYLAQKGALSYAQVRSDDPAPHDPLTHTTGAQILKEYHVPQQ